MTVGLGTGMTSLTLTISQRERGPFPRIERPWGMPAFPYRRLILLGRKGGPMYNWRRTLYVQTGRCGRGGPTSQFGLLLEWWTVYALLRTFSGGCWSAGGFWSVPGKVASWDGNAIGSAGEPDFDVVLRLDSSAARHSLCPGQALPACGLSRAAPRPTGRCGHFRMIAQMFPCLSTGWASLARSLPASLTARRKSPTADTVFRMPETHPL